MTEQQAPTPTAEPRLCYIDPRNRCCAYFTTAPVSGPQRQWGDDWNDAPYEHNSEPPYAWEPYMKAPQYALTRLYFEVEADQPCDGSYNSPWSVEQINAGYVPWLVLVAAPSNVATIMAGETISDFKRKVRAVGGTIYVREEGVQ